MSRFAPPKNYIIVVELVASSEPFAVAATLSLILNFISPAGRSHPLRFHWRYTKAFAYTAIICPKFFYIFRTT